MQDSAPRSLFADRIPPPVYNPASPWKRSGRAHVLLVLLGMMIAVVFVAFNAAGVFGAEGPLVFAAALALLVGPLVFVDPLHGLMVYALLAPLSPDAELAGTKIRLQDPLLAVVLLGVVFRTLRHGFPKVALTLKWPLMTFTVWMILTTAIAYASPAFNEAPRITYLGKQAQYIVLTMCVAASVTAPRHIWMLFAAMAAGYFLQRVQFGWQPHFVTDGERFGGDDIHEQANVLSVYIVLTMGVMLGILDRLRDRFFLALLVLLLAASSVLFFNTLSRTGFLAGGIMMFAAVFVMKRKWIPVVALLTASCFLLLNAVWFNRLTTLGAIIGLEQDSSYESRLNAYRTIWNYVTESPWGVMFGGGRGIKSLSFADTQWGIELLYAGIPGVAIMAILMLAVAHRAFRVWRAGRNRDDAIGAASVACVLTTIAAVITSFGLTSWSAIRTAESIFIMIGLLMATQRMLTMEEKFTQSLPAPPPRQGLGRVREFELSR